MSLRTRSEESAARFIASHRYRDGEWRHVTHQGMTRPVPPVDDAPCVEEHW